MPANITIFFVLEEFKNFQVNEEHSRKSIEEGFSKKRKIIINEIRKSY